MKSEVPELAAVDAEDDLGLELRRLKRHQCQYIAGTTPALSSEFDYPTFKYLAQCLYAEGWKRV